MAPELTALIEAGRGLALEDRLELAHQMLISADGEEPADPFAIDAAWEAEIRRRMDEIESGQVQLVDGTETIRLVRERIAARRAKSFA